MRASILALGILLHVLVAWVMPARSHACSCLGGGIWSSNPLDMATGVPLNQALVVEGDFVAGSVELTDQTGSAVSFELREGPTPACRGFWVELVPAAPLRPNTGYTLRVVPAGPVSNADEPQLSVRFTTGSSMLPVPRLVTPAGRVHVVEGVPDLGACGASNVQACVRLDTEDEIEVIARRDDKIVMRWVRPEASGNYGFGEVPDCLELRRRGPTGERSEPLTFCGDELQLRPFRDTDLSRPFSFSCDTLPAPNAPPSEPRDEPERDDGGAGGSAESPPADSNPDRRADGCTTTAGTRNSPWSVIFVVGLALVLRRMRRARR